MSKTVEELGLIAGGLALAITGGLAAEGLIALSGNLAMFHAMVGIGLTAALSGIGIALRPTNKTVGTPNTIGFSGGATSRRVVYGQFQTAGVLTYASFPPSQNQSTTNQYLHLVYTLTAHEISSFDAVVVNGSIYNFGAGTNGDIIFSPGVSDMLWHIYPDGSGGATDFYWQHIFFEFDFGRNSAAQPFPALASADSTWTSACIQQGCAKVHVMLRADANETALFPAGQIPNIQFLITGKKIVDTRIVTDWLASTGYTEYQWIADAFDVIWVQTNTSGTSGATRPSFEAHDAAGTVLTDGGLSWRSSGLTMTAISLGTDSNPQGHLVGQRLVNDAWAPGMTVAPYQIIEAPLGYLQMCTSETGPTGSTEPNFNLTIGGTVTDGGVDWVSLGRSWNAINPANSALVVNDYLLDTDYGMAALPATIDDSSVSAAANICEEQATIIWAEGSAFVTENQYSCNGMFDFSSNRGDVLSALCGSMAGWCVPPGDYWHVFAGSFVTPTVALGDDDMRGGIKGDFRLSRRDVCNSVKGRYVPAFLPANPAGVVTMTQMPGLWESQPFPAYQANGLAGKPNYLNLEDGGQIIWLDLQLDFTTSMWTAQRLAKIALMRTRFQQTMTLPAKIIALQIEAGDTFSLTHENWGILGQTFEATQVGITLDTEGAKSDAPALGVDIIARQTDPSIYEFTAPTTTDYFGEYSPYGITGVMTGVE